MKNFAFRLVNVFAETTLSGNPLCVFDDARGLSSEQMQALALQFNLSETTFVLPPNNPAADAFVRIFAPGYEMRFAGHPTLGTAQVVADGRNKVTLEFMAGLVPVECAGERWTFMTVTAAAPEHAPGPASSRQTANRQQQPDFEDSDFQQRQGYGARRKKSWLNEIFD